MAGTARSGDRTGDLDDLEHLELVADLEVVEVLEAEAALEALLHLAHVLLEALERIELAGVDHHAAADEAHGRAAAHHAVGHHAAGHGAHLRDLEDVAHLDGADHAFLALGGQHAV